MRRTAKSALALVLTLFSTAGAGAEEAPGDAVVRRALADELNRTMRELSIPGEARLHHAAFAVFDWDNCDAMAEDGAVTLDIGMRARMFVPSLRVGTPALDSSTAGHAGGFVVDGMGFGPRDDDYAAVRRELWLASDAQYKNALQTLAQKKSALSVRVNQRSGDYPDFAPEPAHQTSIPRRPIDWDAACKALRETARRLSGTFKGVPEILDSGVQAKLTVARRRLLTSEGTWADEQHAYSVLRAGATAQAPDGMMLEFAVELTGAEPSTLPSAHAAEAATRGLVAKIAAIREAPLAQSGTAVVLFEGLAAAQLVEALLVPSLSGAPPLRYVPTDMDNSLAPKLGHEVISPLLDVYDDPTLRAGRKGEPLWGTYAADDEGVPARRVDLIQRGVLKTLLMSRSPRKEIRQSNGHYRIGRGVSIGNLVVEAKKPVSRRKLEELAAGSARKLGAGAKVYVVRRLAPRHSFGMQSPAILSSDMPIMLQVGAAAVEAHELVGGKERMVRGLMLERLELRALRDLVAAGSDYYVHNHTPEMPATVITPSLLLADVDVKAYDAENPKPPSYSPP
jgi:TldD protein